MAWSGGAVSALSFIGDGDLVAVCGDAPWVEVWRLAPTVELHTKLELVSYPSSSTFSSTSSPPPPPPPPLSGFVDVDTFAGGRLSGGDWLVAAVSDSAQLCVWKGRGEAEGASLDYVGHFPGHFPRKCKISPDGSRVATYGRDGAVVVWTRAHFVALPEVTLPRPEALPQVRLRGEAEVI